MNKLHIKDQEVRKEREMEAKRQQSKEKVQEWLTKKCSNTSKNEDKKLKEKTPKNSKKERESESNFQAWLKKKARTEKGISQINFKFIYKFPNQLKI